MEISVLFWVLMIVSFLFGTWLSYDAQRPWFKWGGGYLLVFVLLAILGWRVFGPAIKN